MEQQRLPDQLVEATVDAIKKEFRFWGKRYGMGFATKAECYQGMEISICEGFRKVLGDNGLKLCFREADFPHFCREFERYGSGDTSDDPDHVPWLYDAAGEKCEASPDDQRSFFSMMEKLCLTPDYFEPLPEDIPHFHIDQLHQYAHVGLSCTEFDCIDDDGLLSDEDPIGKTFRLKNELGLNAVVTIKKKESRSREADKRTPAEFTAAGYIEGYTATERKCNPEIGIRVGEDKNRPWHLTFWEDAYDRNARNAYPLWQEYLRQCDAKTEKRHSVLYPVFDTYMNLED